MWENTLSYKLEVGEGVPCVLLHYNHYKYKRKPARTRTANFCDSN